MTDDIEINAYLFTGYEGKKTGKIFIGIDPGKSGAVAALKEDGAVDLCTLIPIAGNYIDAATLSDIIYERYAYCNVVACLEKVSAMPGQGVSSTFNFGVSYGIIMGVLSSMTIPYYLVTPQAWRKDVLVGLPKQAKVKGQKKTDAERSQDRQVIKQATIDYCRRAWPELSLLASPRSKKPHDGMADALCIAKYALNHYR